MTRAIRRAMVATNDRKVFRTYGPNGSVWKSGRDGISPRTLWILLVSCLIEDEPHTTVPTPSVTTIRTHLSKAGLDTLRASDVRIDDAVIPDHAPRLHSVNRSGGSSARPASRTPQ